MRPPGSTPPFACAKLAIIAFFALSLAPLAALAAPDDPDPLLRRAFEKGAAGVERPTVQVTREGSTTVLRASADAAEKPALELVCHLCSGLELLDAGRALGASLAEASTGDSPAGITLTGIDSDSSVLIDQIPSVAHSGPKSLEPGPHRILVLDGSGARSIDFTASPGEELELDAGSVPSVKDHSPLRAGIVLTGVGAALAAAGATLMAFDGDCASTVRDAAGNCETIHDLAPAGWTLLGTGAAALLAGVVTTIVSAVRSNDGSTAQEVER